jgi:hypothetical protein
MTHFDVEQFTFVVETEGFALHSDQERTSWHSVIVMQMSLHRYGLKLRSASRS